MDCAGIPACATTHMQHTCGEHTSEILHTSDYTMSQRMHEQQKKKPHGSLDVGAPALRQLAVPEGLRS